MKCQVCGGQVNLSDPPVLSDEHWHIGPAYPCLVCRRLHLPGGKQVLDRDGKEAFLDGDKVAFREPLPKLPEVLVVEQTSWTKIWEEHLVGVVKPIFASSLEEAQEKFAHNQHFAAIVIGDVLGNVLLATKALSKRFRGPMIASPTFMSRQAELQGIGCGHGCSKEILPQVLREVLGLTARGRGEVFRA